jgi:nucleoside-diphosphate-sugar epimerase
MRVFVTGGTGLVGSHSIQLLRKHGHTVHAMVRDETGKSLVEALGATAVFGSVEDPQSWKHATGTDAIVHSAAVIATRRSWETFQAINIDGARNAALAAASQGARLVHISSVAVYGRGAGSGAEHIDETTEWAELSPAEFYGLSKRRAEEAVFAVARESGLSAVALRPCVIYGERDRTFLPPVMRVLRLGFAPMVGSGDNPLSIVYAGNVADAVLATLEHPEVEGPINVTNDGDVTQREFYAAVGSAMNRRLRFLRIPIPAAVAFTAMGHWLRSFLAPEKYAGFGASAVRFLSRSNPYKSDRAQGELGWEPTTIPKEAISRSVRWFDASA